MWCSSNYFRNGSALLFWLFKIEKTGITRVFISQLELLNKAASTFIRIGAHFACPFIRRSNSWKARRYKLEYLFDKGFFLSESYFSTVEREFEVDKSTMPDFFFCRAQRKLLLTIRKNFFAIKCCLQIYNSDKNYYVPRLAVCPVRLFR